MKAYNNETEQFAMHTVDAINKISNEMATSSTALSQGMSKTASAMSALNNNYDESLALLTAGSEIMQGQTSKVARGLRTIGNNFANTAKKSKELSYEVQGTTKTISLFDEKTKDLKSTYEIFNSMADDWEKMTNAEKQNLAITYAGGRIGLAPNRLKCGKDGVVSVSEHNVWMSKAFSTKVA